ncbi:MAG TPA: NHL repeat-containing protein [Pyrinomonadaceae bacterium]|nr:NHL repeat-containing protein [Pyrinomonadaceae bacterium]
MIAPNESVGQPAQIVHIKFGSGGGFSKWLWVLLAIPIFGLVIGILAAAGVLAPIIYSVSRSTPTTPPNTPARPVTPKGGTVNTFASVLLDFGSEGIGPGMFNDARSIAVDGDGRIYVGEYTGGRIQVFDPAGKFVSQWTIGDRKTLLRGLAADRKGTVYAVHGGQIDRYRGETGENVGQVKVDGSGIDDVTAAVDGGLVTARHGGRDDIVVFDSGGKVVRTIPSAISGASGDSELSMRVAVDGSGQIFALGRFNEGVFKFARDGKFMTRFGDGGDKPGQFRAPYSIAVDGFGRVYVGDMKGIQVFDGNGRYLGLITLKNMAFGMVVNDKNELFVIARDHVVKFALPAQQ